MIKNKYTNQQLSKIPKYRKFLMFRTFNLLILVTLYTVATFNSVMLIPYQANLGLLYFFAYSFVILIIVLLHNYALYGLTTSVKRYQARVIKVLQNNKSRHGLLVVLITILYTILAYFIISKQVIFLGVFAIVCLVVQFILVDTNDLGKIKKRASKLEVDIDEYRILDNDIFENLTREQIFYVYAKREEIVVYMYLTKELTAEQFKAKLDKEEYLLVTMMAKQMEDLGR